MKNFTEISRKNRVVDGKAEGIISKSEPVTGRNFGLTTGSVKVKLKVSIFWLRFF
jgi:hypothetical protein